MFRNKKCIFLGYGSNYKGYRCLDPLANKVVITWHVVFDEMSFPAKAEVLSSIPTPAHPSGIPISIHIADFTFTSHFSHNDNTLFAMPIIPTTPCLPIVTPLFLVNRGNAN
jgi:hypothetical protein